MEPLFYLFVAGYAICGALAYGLFLGTGQHATPEEDWKDCVPGSLVLGILGPVGLFIVFLLIVSIGVAPRIMYRIPSPEWCREKRAELQEAYRLSRSGEQITVAEDTPEEPAKIVQPVGPIRRKLEV